MDTDIPELQPTDLYGGSCGGGGGDSDGGGDDGDERSGEESTAGDGQLEDNKNRQRQGEIKRCVIVFEYRGCC